MGTPKTWRNVEIEQQIKFGFTVEKINSVMPSWNNVSGFAFIVHDKDVNDDGTPKEPHIHLMIAFKEPEQTTNILAKFKGCISTEQLQKIKGWKAAIAYLTHRTKDSSHKHQYDISEVTSFNVEVGKITEEYNLPIKDKRLLEILAGIRNGSIQKYNYTKYISDVEFIKYKKQIDYAFSYKLDILNSKGDRNMECIYIYGNSGTGKTTYAKDLCENVHHLEYYVSSGSNDILDDYKGQPCIILDDFRSSCLPYVSDFLKLLDNNTSSSVRSRYRNINLQCKLLIITTIYPIDEFFDNIYGNEKETSRQLKRRCKTLLHFDEEYFETFIYSEKDAVYKSIGKFPNPVSMKFNEMTFEEQKNKALELLGLVSDNAAAAQNVLREEFENMLEPEDFVQIEMK